MSKDNTVEETEMAEWQEICRKLNLRDETVGGVDEQGIIRNHYLKWFAPKQALTTLAEQVRREEREKVRILLEKGYVNTLFEIVSGKQSIQALSDKSV